jgi:uncharacterized protein (TIRG00374 family)
LKRPLQVTVALVLTGLLLYFFVDVRELAKVLGGVDAGWAVLTVVVITGDRLLMSFKWTLLLRVRGYRVPLTHALMVYCTAMVWGLALPSTLGADAIRAALIRRRGVEYRDSVATIMVERGVGFVSALGMGLLSVLTLRFVLPGAHEYDFLLVIGAAAMIVALLVLVLSFTQRAFDWFVALLPRRWQHAALIEKLARLHDTYRSLATDRRTLAWFTVLTGVQQMYLLGVTWMVARSLGMDVNLLYFLAAAPLAFLASRLPVSFDGIGVYEAIFVAVMSVSGLSPAQSFAIAACGRVYNLITWMPWFMVFLFTRDSSRLDELRRAEARPPL